MQPLVNILEERQRINDTIRAFFRSRGYLEVETPIVVASPDVSPNLTPFETTVTEPNGTPHRAALITSPEFSMKKLLGEGLEKIFTLTKVFRNGESFGGLHNPEFTMIEWYSQGKDYHACMEETEALVQAVGKAFGTSWHAFRKERVRDLFLRHVGVDLDQADENVLRQTCATHQITTSSDDTESDLFYRLFLGKVEPHLGKDPVFVYDYPKYQAALSRLTPDGRYGQRFELYIDGVELCNGFTELTDAKEQRARFASELAERKQFEKPTFPVDEELLRLLPSVRQPTFGNALGVDRLHLVATQRSSIEDILPFPASKLFSS